MHPENSVLWTTKEVPFSPDVGGFTKGTITTAWDITQYAVKQQSVSILHRALSISFIQDGSSTTALVLQSRKQLGIMVCNQNVWATHTLCLVYQ
jgi:hypothetical protein